MPVYTFSTKPNSDEEAIIKKIKLDCHNNMINFSAFVVEALKVYTKKDTNDQRRA